MKPPTPAKVLALANRIHRDCERSLEGLAPREQVQTEEYWLAIQMREAIGAITAEERMIRR